MISIVNYQLYENIIYKMNLVSKNNNNTKSLIKELNREWRNYTREIDNIISNENIPIQKNVTFIIRRKKGCSIPLSDIFEDELKIMDKIISELNK